jgi:hypothetical protein
MQSVDSQAFATCGVRRKVLSRISLEVGLSNWAVSRHRVDDLAQGPVQ